MTIVEGQIETLKKLRESLSRSGVTRFSSIGEIRRFLKDFETEKKQLPRRIEGEFDAQVQGLKSTLATHRRDCDELQATIRNEIEQQIQKLEAESERVRDKRNSSMFYRVLYVFRGSSLSRRATKLEDSKERIIKKKTRSAKKTIAGLEREIDGLLNDKSTLLSKRCEKSLDDLIRTKEVVDGLYPLVAGAVGETAVVNALHQLSDDYYLINDFSLKFNRPIYNKKEDDRIFSVQIDHLLVGKSGVFLLETKNWSKSSVESLDLRSPVSQILRTGFALFVLLNSDPRKSGIRLARHHWGVKKIPIRNIIVMTNAKPKEEFKHVKVLSLNELVRYIRYFDEIFDGEEVRSIFEYLQNRM